MPPRAARSTSPERRQRTAKGRRPPPAPESYAVLSTRPLHILVFLAPLIVAYEIGSLLYLTNPQTNTVETIRAHRLLSGFFETFGVGGLFLPGLLLAAVLLIWHALTRDRWRLELRVLPMMLAESAAWTIPLLVLWQIIATASRHASGLAMAAVDTAAGGAAGGGAAAMAELSLPARLTISVGAGLYEELLFRMLAIAAIHFVTADLLKLKPRLAAGIAVVGSAAAFALYHLSPGAGVDWTALAFYFAAGVYFAAIYAWRGFGIVVATHALYDVVVLVGGA